MTPLEDHRTSSSRTGPEPSFSDGDLAAVCDIARILATAPDLAGAAPGLAAVIGEVTGASRVGILPAAPAADPVADGVPRLIVPLHLRGAVVGALELIAAPGREHDRRTAALLDTAGLQIGLALERWAAEAERRRSDTRFRAVFDANMVGIGIRDTAGQVIDANDALLAMIGYTREDLLAGAIAWGQLTPPDYFASDEKAVAQLEALGTCTPYEKEYIRKDGTRFPVLVTGSRPASSDCGAFFVLDRSDRRDAEDAMRRSEERLRAALAVAEMGTRRWDLAAGCEIRDANLNGILGLSPVESTQPLDEYLDHLHPDDRPIVREAMDRALVGLGTYDTEYQIVRPGGELRRLRDRGRVVCDREGEPLYLVSAVIDITEQRQAEETIRHTQKLESIGMLAGGIAHDFNNLLTGILGNASLALRALPAEAQPQVGPLVRDVIRASERAADLTNQLLAYAGKGRFYIQEVDVCALVDELAGLLRSSISRKVELDLDLDGGAPRVAADASQLQQLIMNLILNGAEAIGDATGSVRITAAARDLAAADLRRHFPAVDLAPGRYLWLEVADTGCGMDEATRSRIFDPFFTTKFTGRGLGLAAALGIVRGHGGAIAVQSTPGAGTVFRVVLPGVGESLLLDVPAAGPSEPRGSGLVLVVDDEEVVRRTAQVALEDYGYTVLVAENGLRALELFRAHGDAVDLVLLDMTMPVMDGEEAIGHLKAIHPGVHVLVTSGYGEAETMRHFVAGDISGFIQKPYAAAQLAERVRAVLEASDSP